MSDSELYVRSRPIKFLDGEMFLMIKVDLASTTDEKQDWQVELDKWADAFQAYLLERFPPA